MTEIERLVVTVIAQADQAKRTLSEMERAFGSLADVAGQQASRAADALTNPLVQAAQRIGKAFEALSEAIASPLVKGVQGAVMAAAAYEKSLAQITGLAGESREQVAAWSKELLAMGPALGKSPQELSEALYFISSAGLHGAEALKALEVSAKLSAAGMGQTKVIADALTSVINAYASENISAAQAADVLTASVRYGKLEADQLVRVMGQIMPVTSAMGVSFEDAMASLAAMSSVGMSASQAAVSLQGFLSGLSKPSEEGAKALERVGLSYTQLRNLVRQDGGTIAAMRLLQKTLGANDEAMAAIIPNSRAFRGEMALLSQNAAKVDEVFRGVTNSTGDHEKVFQNAAQTMSFAFDQAKASLKAAAIQVGEIFGPMVKDVARAAGQVMRWFDSWPGVLKQTVVITGLVTAGVVAMAAAWAGVALAVAVAAAAITIATGGLNLVALGIIGAAVAIYSAMASVVGIVLGLGVAGAYVTGSFGRMRDAVAEIWEELLPVRQALESLVKTVSIAAVAAFETLGNVVTQTWKDISGGARIDWTKVKDYALDAVLAIEYGVLQAARTFDLLSAGAQYALEVIKNTFGYVFTDVLLALGSWLFTNMPAMMVRAFIASNAAVNSVLLTLFDWIIDAFKVILDNVGRLFRSVDWAGLWSGMKTAAREVLKDTIDQVAKVMLKLPELVRNPERFVAEWAVERPVPKDAEVRKRVELIPPPAQDAAKIAEDAQRAADRASRGMLDITPFTLPVRVEGTSERELRQEWERLAAASGVGFADFREMKLKQFAELERVEKLAAEERKRNPPRVEEDPWNSGKMRREKETWEAALFASAEAASRIAKYHDVMAGVAADAREMEAQREARVAAERATALQNELWLTEQIAAKRREIIRMQEDVGVRTARVETPAPGQMVNPLILDDIEHLDNRSRHFRAAPRPPRVPPVEPEVMDQIRDAQRLSQVGGLEQARAGYLREAEAVRLAGEQQGLRELAETMAGQYEQMAAQAQRQIDARLDVERNNPEQRQRQDEQPRSELLSPRRARELEDSDVVPVRTAQQGGGDGDETGKLTSIERLLVELVNQGRRAERKPPIILDTTDSERG